MKNERGQPSLESTGERIYRTQQEKTLQACTHSYSLISFKTGDNKQRTKKRTLRCVPVSFTPLGPAP